MQQLPDVLDRRARVLVLIDWLLAGGAERVAVELACALDQTRFLPHVMVTRGSGPLEQMLLDRGIGYTVLDRRRTLDRAAWKAMRDRAHASDVIHSHKFGSNVWGALLSRSAGVPLIVHEHNFSADVDLTRRVLDRYWIAPAASRVVCVSDSVADVERQIGISDAQLVVVPNGVHVSAAWPRAAARDELWIGSEEFVVGIVGRLRPEKAHDIALRALAQLRDSGRQVRLCIVGDGPCAPELRALERELCLPHDSVIWAGERENAARLAAAFDVSLICSHWEGLPLAALESMAAEVPLVASAVGGLVDLLAGERGLLVPAGDVSGFAAAIAVCMDDPDRARSMAAAARKRVRDEYTFRRMVQRVEGLYTAVLNEANGIPVRGAQLVREEAA